MDESDFAEPKVKAAAKPAGKRKAQMPHPKSSVSEGQRQVSTRRYSQKFLRDIPSCHIQTWLAECEPVLANAAVTKTLDRETLLSMMTFMLGWHPADEPVESSPQ